jgi:Protein of unknown function (DUF3293)
MALSTSPPPSGEARLAELIHAYLAADYRWELDGRWMHLRIGETAPEPEAWQPDAGCFGLLSAWDPQSIPRQEAVNRHDDARLHQDLLATGLPLRAAFSSAVNRTWREPSWLIAALPADRLDTLSRRYGQLATLFWTRGEPVRLRVDAMQPAAFDDHPWVDWIGVDRIGVDGAGFDEAGGDQTGVDPNGIDRATVA